MRLLFLTSRLPYPPDRGDRFRVFNFLKRLSAEHEITLVSFVEGGRDRLHKARLSEYCAAVHTVRQTRIQSILAVALNSWRAVPLQALYYRSGAMRRWVREIASTERFDAVYIHLFRMAQYADLFPDAYRIADLTDAISQEIERSLPYRQRLSRALYRIEQGRIERYERFVAKSSDEAWLVSERDRRVIARASPEANLIVIPNGVDADQFRPLSTVPDNRALLFVGNMSVLHNIDAVLYFVRSILPKVQWHLPDVRLTVVGADPVRTIRALDEQPTVTVTGYVDDLNAVLNEAAVFVAPLRFAAGVQTKVIEAMAAGRPVVTTSVVNEGIRGVHGRDLLVADDADLFAEHVVALIRDSERRRKLGAAARRFAVERFRWETAVERMRVIEDVGASRT